MDKYQLKSGKRTKRHSFIINFIGVAVLLGMAVLVLLYGRFEAIDIPKVQEETADNTADNNTANNNNTEALSDEQREVLRQKYIAQMGLYENETKAIIETLNLAAWSPESAAELHEIEQEAIKAFAENQFGAALTHLDNLFEKVSQLQLLQRQNFQSALTNAQRSFAAEQAEQARAAIEDALRYLPEGSEALLLKARIDTMDAVLTLVKQADIARTENNLAEEIKLLDQAIKLDSYRDDLIERHQMLIEKQRQQKLDALLQQATQALDDKNIKAAQALLSQIRQIDANHPSLNLLTAKVKQSQSELSYQNLIAKAKSSEDADDWQTAEGYYRQALGIFPNNKDIEDSLQRAIQINRHTQTIKQALAKPERLADDQIASAMQQIAKDSIAYAEHSAQLRQLVVQLGDTLTEMSKPVPVTVYSDEQTHVSVLSVGIIGKVREYKLKAGLKPGRYLFKGERKGYKDKLVEVNIKPNQAAVVRVICDETI